MKRLWVRVREERFHGDMGEAVRAVLQRRTDGLGMQGVFRCKCVDRGT